VDSKEPLTPSISPCANSPVGNNNKINNKIKGPKGRGFMDINKRVPGFQDP
jgi:hypothetical protein